MKPVLVVPGTDYVVCFNAAPEDSSMRHHFIDECGWTPKQFRRIENFDWFCAEVCLWKGGKELATKYLGACCYRSEDEFWTTYACDYFSDMVCELLAETPHAEWAKTWRQDLRNKASSTLKDPA